MFNTREEIINKVKEFVQNNLMKIASFEGCCQREAEYRIEHSYRVANIMREVALKKGFDEEKTYVEKVLDRLSKLREVETGTITGRKMWEEKIDYQIDFYKKLLKQIENSK